MLIGGIILLIGLLFLFEVLIPGFEVDFNLIWPIILVVIGLYNMIKERKMNLLMTVLTFVGVWFILINFNILPDKYTQIFWPIVVILIGIFIIFNSITFKKKLQKVNKEGFLKFYGVFGGVEEHVKTNDFKGAEIYSIFGGVELDLTDIKIKNEESFINVYSIFGGTDIKLPKDYNIIFQSTTFLGGNDNKNKHDFKEGNKTIYINCVSIFGGTDIE